MLDRPLHKPPPTGQPSILLRILGKQKFSKTFWSYCTWDLGNIESSPVAAFFVHSFYELSPRFR